MLKINKQLLLIAFFLLAIVQKTYAVDELFNVESILYDRMNYTKIFDQSEVLKDFLNNSYHDKEVLDEALVVHYQDGKNSAMRSALYAPLFFTGLPIALTSFFLHVTKNDNAKGLLQFTLIAYLAGMAQQLFKIGYCFASPLSDPLAPYEERYAQRKRFLAPTLQTMVEDKFSAARKTPTTLDATLMFANIALNLPLSSKQLKMPSQKELDVLLSGYDPVLDFKLTSKFFHHYKRTSFTQESLKTPKSIIYLQGPPGTGKTFVTRQFAQLMDAPLIELKVSNDLSTFVGTEKSPGSFLEAIAKAGMVRNAIILIDDADLVINRNDASLELFLPLLEPDALYFYSPFLRENIDISHFCFVLAGNTAIKSSALKSRLQVVEFKGFSKAFKQSIVDTMVEQAKETQLLRSLDEPLKQSINALVDKSINIRELRLQVSDLIDQHELKMAW